MLKCVPACGDFFIRDAYHYFKEEDFKVRQTVINSFGQADEFMI